ncbi:MAG: hypothetical protein WC738_00480 [Candidatus Omnitrophota bacterium]|jgi:hypothetical protein
MKYRIFFIAFVVLAVSFFGIIETTVAKDNQADNKTAAVISDAAVFKLLLLDLGYNIVGLGWQDRGAVGAGKADVEAAWHKVLSKYNMTPNYVFSNVMPEDNDLPNPPGLSGSKTESGVNIYLRLPDKWCEVLLVKQSGSLPDVKFKNGGIGINLNTMKVTFEDKTECAINGKEYIYNNGKWFEK